MTAYANCIWGIQRLLSKPSQLGRNRHTRTNPQSRSAPSPTDRGLFQRDVSCDVGKIRVLSPMSFLFWASPEAPLEYASERNLRTSKGATQISMSWRTSSATEVEAPPSLSAPSARREVAEVL